MGAQESKKLVAIVGFLGAMLGGAVAAGADYYFDTRAREAADLATRRTDAYLNFIKFRNEEMTKTPELDGAIDKLFGDGRSESDGTDTTEVCDNLILARQWPDAWPEWTEDQKSQVRDLCVARRKVWDELLRTRDKVAIYGSQAVISALAEWERSQYQYDLALAAGDESIPRLAKDSRDKYADMLVTMRCDGQENCEINKDDILVVICGPSNECFGFEDDAHLNQR